MERQASRRVLRHARPSPRLPVARMGFPTRPWRPATPKTPARHAKAARLWTLPSRMNMEKVELRALSELMGVPMRDVESRLTRLRDAVRDGPSVGIRVVPGALRSFGFALRA